MLLFLKNLLFTVLVPGTVGVYVPWLLGRGGVGGGQQCGPIRYLSLVPFAMGSAVYLWCLWDFAVFGRGTPAPLDAPKRLVVRGLYRYVRNPMYVGVLTVVAGWLVFFATAALLIYLLSVWLAFHLFVVFYEERVLRRVFGDEYGRYCAGVPRWLPKPIPGRPGG